MDEQHDKFVNDFGGLGVGGRGQWFYCEGSQTLTSVVVSRPASFERRRPRDGYIPPRREEPYPDPRGGGRDPRRDPDIDDRLPRGPQRPPPPPAPDAPGSPTTSSTSNTFSSRSSNLNSVLSGHWLREVFHPNLPSTSLEDAGQTYVTLASAFVKHLLTAVQVRMSSPTYARVQRQARGERLCRIIRAVSGTG